MLRQKKINRINLKIPTFLRKGKYYYLSQGHFREAVVHCASQSLCLMVRNL